MKNFIPYWFPLILIFAIVFSSCNNRIVRNAKYKTESEINKKVNKGIEGVFNEDEPQNGENPTTTNNPNPKNDTTNDPDEIEKDSKKLNTNDSKLIRTKSDFIPGHKVIFWDTLNNEQLGEFPSRWDLKRGGVENMNFGGKNVIGFIASQSDIIPLMDKENYLPEMFTIEFDCYFYNYGNEGYYLKFNTISTNIRINKNGVKFQDIMRTEVKELVGWRHIEISFNKRALKLYYEGERLLNIPRLHDKPTSVSFGALSPGRTKEKYAMIKNIRIAEGGVPLYNRLMTEGKIITNDIHFDYNKATLKAESIPVIAEIAQLMKKHPEIKFSIEGHTDSDGSETFNQSLSEQRALAVKTELINQQIDSSKLQTKGWGENNPIDNNNTTQGKTNNRRVEFIMLK